MPPGSGKNRLAMNGLGGLGDHFDRERRPDRGFEAADVRSKVLCKGDGFRGQRKLATHFVFEF